MRAYLVFLSHVLAAQAACAAAAPMHPPATHPVARLVSDTQICATGIAAAERQVALPPKLLQTIGIVESGRADPTTGRVSPWPWTIDAAGTPYTFSTKAAAISAVQTLQKQGVASIDVGCLQINLMHHPNAFVSLDDAFDPSRNTLYGARFLNALYRETGNWPQAAAAYHSRTQDIGWSYESRVMAIWPMAYKFPDPTANDHIRVTAAPDPELAGFTPEFAARMKQMRADSVRLQSRSHLIVPVEQPLGTVVPASHAPAPRHVRHHPRVDESLGASLASRVKRQPS